MRKTLLDNSALYYQAKMISRWKNKSSSISSIESAPSDLTATGSIIYLIAGEDASFGQIGKINSSGTVSLAIASNLASATGLVMCVDETIGSGSLGKWLLNGTATDESWTWTFGDTNGLIFLSKDTSGGMTQPAPSGLGIMVQILGIALSATTIYFDPELVQIERRS